MRDELDQENPMIYIFLKFAFLKIKNSFETHPHKTFFHGHFQLQFYNIYIPNHDFQHSFFLLACLQIQPRIKNFQINKKERNKKKKKNS